MNHSTLHAATRPATRSDAANARGWRRCVVALALGVVLMAWNATPTLAEEVNDAGWFVPEYERYGLQLTSHTRDRDLVARCPGREHVQQLWLMNAFRLPQAVREEYDLAEDALLLLVVNTLASNGRVSSIFLDTDLTFPMETTLVDRAGDGVFRHRYGPEDTRIDTPPWLLEACGGDGR